jgi:hypothetical protein
MNPTRFTGKEGELVSAEKAKTLTVPHQRKEKECRDRGENYVRAEFFGIHTFNDMIRIHGDNCVGFRAYYGLSDEDDMDEAAGLAGKAPNKRPTPRLILVPVDAYGKDLTSTAHLGGLKDMPAQGEVMTGGPLCPNQC